MKTLCFNEHYQAFEVENSDEYKLMRLSNLSSLRSWNLILKSDETFFIVYCHHHNYVSSLEDKD